MYLRIRTVKRPAWPFVVEVLLETDTTIYGTVVDERGKKALGGFKMDREDISEAIPVQHDLAGVLR